MTNRLADLESNISRGHKKTAKAHKSAKTAVHMRKPQGVLKRVSAPPPPTLTPSTKASVAVAKGLGGLVSRWPSRAAGRALASGAIEYTIPGLFSPLAQPTPMSCWATAFTMLLSWRRQQSLKIEDALAQTGQRWLDIYRADTGLPGDEHGTFFTAAGLVAEPLQSFSIDGWERLLRDFGPIIITANELPGRAWAMHARVIIGIRGGGTEENTTFTIVDPNGGRTYQESISVFIPKYEDEVRRTGNSRIQVAHWSADARAEVRAQSFGGRTNRPSSRTNAMAAPVLVPIASTILGAGMTRLLNNEGDIKYELEQLQGLKHVDNDPSTAGSAPYTDEPIVTVFGPHASLGKWPFPPRDIYANIEIKFQHNGHSLGNVQISIVHSKDVSGAALVVKATITDDANFYVRKPSTDRFAAIKVRIHYHFTFTLGDDYIFIDDITLYGDGTHDFKRRQTQ